MSPRDTFRPRMVPLLAPSASAFAPAAARRSPTPSVVRADGPAMTAGAASRCTGASPLSRVRVYTRRQ